MLDPSTASRYYQYQQFKYNRTWVPTTLDYLGRHGEPELRRVSEEREGAADVRPATLPPQQTEGRPIGE